MGLTITVVTIAKNEHDLMPFFMRHYKRFANRIIVYDESTDDTPTIVKEHGGEVIKMEPGNGLRDDINAEIKSQAGSKFGGDWIMVPDVDEFLYHHDIRGLLAEYTARHITLPRVKGFAMYGDHRVTAGLLTDHFPMGLPDAIYNKRIVYHTSLNMVYRPGAHKGNAKGSVPSVNEDIKLLHYKYVFGWEWLYKRLTSVVLSPENEANGWGAQIKDIERYRRHYSQLAQQGQRVI